MKVLLPNLLLATALFATPALAQHGSFQVGPTGGATLATAHFDRVPDRTDTPLRAGFAAGLTGSYQSPGHWGVQVAGLFTQQGYHWHYDSPTGDYRYEDNVRLNYVRLPLQATFSQWRGGQGWQVVAGPYVGVLLGGYRSFEPTFLGNAFSYREPVHVADTRTLPAAYLLEFSNRPDYSFYSRRFDVGLQGGVGYRLGNALLQAGYTLGLRNLATTMVYESSSFAYAVAGEPYRTRGWQASLTYLLGPRK